MFTLNSYTTIIMGLFFYSLSALAADSMVEKQRQFQKQMYQRFTKLDHQLNGTAIKKNMTETRSSTVIKPSIVDNIAFPNNERDPFAVPYQLLQFLTQEHAKKGITSSASLYTKMATTSLPKVKLKGILHHQNKPSPLAIVLLNNETYMVRNGDEIGFNANDPSQVIKIKEIKRLSVLIEVGTLGELVIVR